MPDLRQLDGGSADISSQEISNLAERLDGELLSPGSERYETTRTLWNAMIDRRPELIAACASEDDVVHAVRFAAEHDLLTSVCGAGHNIAGNAVCDGGLMISVCMVP